MGQKKSIVFQPNEKYIMTSYEIRKMTFEDFNRKRKILHLCCEEKYEFEVTLDFRDVLEEFADHFSTYEKPKVIVVRRNQSEMFREVKQSEIALWRALLDVYNAKLGDLDMQKNYDEIKMLRKFGFFNNVENPASDVDGKVPRPAVVEKAGYYANATVIGSDL
jgi:hypothetical protein